MKNKTIGYILITPFVLLITYILIVLPVIALIRILSGEPIDIFSYRYVGLIILSFEAAGLLQWLTDLGFKLIDKEEKKK